MRINTYLAGLPTYLMKVLVVEDEAFHAEVLEKMLRTLGFRDMAHACNGTEALEMAKDTSYHLILSDRNMPGMDGYTLVDQLRKGFDSLYTQIPIIMLTSSRDFLSVQQAIQAGITHYIAKPFDISTLRDKIVEAFAHKTRPIYLPTPTTLELGLTAG